MKPSTTTYTQLRNLEELISDRDALSRAHDLVSESFNKAARGSGRRVRLSNLSTELLIEIQEINDAIREAKADITRPR